MAAADDADFLDVFLANYDTVLVERLRAGLKEATVTCVYQRALIGLAMAARNLETAAPKDHHVAVNDVLRALDGIRALTNEMAANAVRAIGVHVTMATYFGDYKLRLAFDDGTCGVVDLAGDLDGKLVFEALKNKDVFAKAYVDGGTVCWPNGADFAAEYLHAKVTSR